MKDGWHSRPAPADDGGRRRAAHELIAGGAALVCEVDATEDEIAARVDSGASIVDIAAVSYFEPKAARGGGFRGKW
jgi:hypothetical protein